MKTRKNNSALAALAKKYPWFGFYINHLDELTGTGLPYYLTISEGLQPGKFIFVATHKIDGRQILETCTLKRVESLLNLLSNFGF